LEKEGVEVDHPYTRLLKQIVERLRGAPQQPGANEPPYDGRSEVQKSLDNTTSNFRLATALAIQELRSDCQNKVASIKFGGESSSTGGPGLDLYHAMITMTEYVHFATEYEQVQAGAFMSQLGAFVPGDPTLSEYIASRPPARGIARQGDALIILTNNFMATANNQLPGRVTLVHELLHITYSARYTNDGVGITGHSGLARALGLFVLPLDSGFDLRESTASDSINRWLTDCLKQ
jgi:hypothetical protein